MEEEMLKAWQKWHNDITLEIMPEPNPSFKRGFESGYKKGVEEGFSDGWRSGASHG